MAFFSLDFSLHPCKGYIHIYHIADNRLQAIHSPISSSSLFTLHSMWLQTRSWLCTMAVSSLCTTLGTCTTEMDMIECLAFNYMCHRTDHDSMLSIQLHASQKWIWFNVYHSTTCVTELRIIQHSAFSNPSLPPSTMKGRELAIIAMLRPLCHFIQPLHIFQGQRRDTSWPTKESSQRCEEV